MVSRNLLAFDSSGPRLAIADGDDLLVHGGPDETPQWTRKLQAKAVGVGAGGGMVVTLDDSGLLTWWSGSGEVLGTTPLGDAPLALAGAPDGQACVVLYADRIVLVEHGAAARTLRIPEVTAAAFSADGGRVAIGNAAGLVKIMTFAGEPIGETQLETGVRSLAASPKGTWYATAGERVLKLDAQATSVQRVTRAGGFTPDCLSVSEDGLLFAVRLNDNLVMSLEDPPDETIAQIRYPERKATGVAFGRGHVFHIGLDGGDANYVDIGQKQLRRTETFAGREHVRWLVGVTLNAPKPAPAAAPSKPAAAPAPKAAPAAKGPEAWATPFGADPAPAPVATPEAPKGSAVKSWALTIVGLLILTVAVWWKVSAEERSEKEQRDREQKERIQESVRDSVKKSLNK
ncbi:MAG: hypothetical protein HOV80_31930 [Polyangiaceae bacterium]|nr:hypothetical protein [Polyangiaceae bacterium]